jgi:PilZ domain
VYLSREKFCAPTQPAAIQIGNHHFVVLGSFVDHLRVFPERRNSEHYAIPGLRSATRTDSQLPLSATAPHKGKGTTRYGSIQWIRRIASFKDWRYTMADGPYAVRRANPRFSFFADAEITLRDGTGVRAQLAELSSRGCYIDTLEPIPSQTKLRLRICDGMNTCELRGKVLYLHSGGGFGIFGMGVAFEEMDSDQQSAIDAWLRGLAGRRPGKDSAKNSFSQTRI